MIGEPNLKFTVENGNNTDEQKATPMFKHALVAELKKVIDRTEGPKDQDFYRGLMMKIKEPNGIEELLEGGKFTMDDIANEYEKKFEDGTKMPTSENLVDIIQYLKFQFKQNDGYGNTEGVPVDDKKELDVA